MGSITDIFSGISEGGSAEGGSSTTNITDQIAETVGDAVATLLKSVLGNLS